MVYLLKYCKVKYYSSVQFLLNEISFILCNFYKKNVKVIKKSVADFSENFAYKKLHLPAGQPWLFAVFSKNLNVAIAKRSTELFFIILKFDVQEISIGSRHENR